MGSMADVNTPEKTLEANEGVNQVTAVPVVEGSLPEVAGEHAAMPDPKSPTEGKGDKPDEADVEILDGAIARGRSHLRSNVVTSSVCVPR